VSPQGASADRREALGDLSFGEDPNVSMILALGGIISGTRLDETLRNIASTHPHEHTLVESIVKNYWPDFVRLNMDDQQRWITGSWLLGTNAPQGAGIAVHCFARVTEGELRVGLFARFADYASSHPALLTDCRDDDKIVGPFCRYLKGQDKNLGLGSMFKILGVARRPATAIISSFAGWLKSDYPWLLASLDRLRTDKVVAYRNRENHPDIRIEVHEAEEMGRICREIINLLHAR
jgi:hypothetical protein